MSRTVAAPELVANRSGYPEDGSNVGQDEGVPLDPDHEARVVPFGICRTRQLAGHLAIVKLACAARR
jgi:hypothetical protein